VASIANPEELASAILSAAREPGRLLEMRANARAAIDEAGMSKAAMLEGYHRVLESTRERRHTAEHAHVAD